MSLQWTLIAGFLYAETAIVLLLVLPIFSPQKWQKFFKSRFLQTLSSQARFYFLVLLGILVLFLLDALREMRKYGNEPAEQHQHLDAEMQGNMRLFRAQRNFYISGYALFLYLVIHRLVTLISTQASLLAQHEAAMRQAQSATSTAKSLLSQKSAGESAQNNSNEAYDKTVSELEAAKAKIKDLESDLKREKKDKEAMKSQAESLNKEYDRLSQEHNKLLQSSDKKTD